jgi:hypothetical protein
LQGRPLSSGPYLLDPHAANSKSITSELGQGRGKVVRKTDLLSFVGALRGRSRCQQEIPQSLSAGCVSKRPAKHTAHVVDGMAAQRNFFIARFNGRAERRVPLEASWPPGTTSSPIACDLRPKPVRQIRRPGNVERSCKQPLDEIDQCWVEHYAPGVKNWFCASTPIPFAVVWESDDSEAKPPFRISRWTGLGWRRPHFAFRSTGGSHDCAATTSSAKRTNLDSRAPIVKIIVV